MLNGIPVTENRYLQADVWGYFIGGAIITPNAKRLARNADNLGIDRRTGKIELLPGKVERAAEDVE